MGRNKTLTDEDSLERAGAIFIQRGHAVPTREVAKAVGLSQATLLQRFGSKDDLFVAAVAPEPLDLAAILGRWDGKEPQLTYLEGLLMRLNVAIATVMPALLRAGLATDLSPEHARAVHNAWGPSRPSRP